MPTPYALGEVRRPAFIASLRRGHAAGIRKRTMQHTIVLTSILFTACASSSRPPPGQRLADRRARTSHGELSQRCHGARTSLSMLDDGVEMRITAEAPAARHEIALRADKHLQMGAPAGQAPEHTGLHGGPGSIGCAPSSTT